MDHYAFLGNRPPCGRGIVRLWLTNSKIPGLTGVGLKASISVLVFLVFLHLFASVLHTADEMNNKLALHPL